MNEKSVAYPPNDPNHPLWGSLYECVTASALRARRRYPHDPALEPVEYLANAPYPDNTSATRKGASYRSLAYVAHRLGMSDEERKRWYVAARELPLSQAHFGTIIARLNERDAAISGLEEMLSKETGDAT
jgi:hypothetical protein